MKYTSAADSVKLLSIVVVLISAINVVLVSCQGPELVYRGTGVNGSHDQTTSNNDTIVIGGLFSIHRNANNKCGRIRIYHIQYMEAMILAIHKINSNDSLLPGVTLAYEIRDTCINVNFALEQTLHFVTEEKTLGNGKRGSVSGVIGTPFSFTSIAVANLLRLFQIPQISYSASTEELSDKSRYDYFLRMSTPDSLQARAIADIIIHFNWTYIIVVHSDDSYGKGGITSLTNELKSSNLSSHICIAATIAVSDSTTITDYDQIMESIAQEWVENSSVIVLFGHLSNAEALFEAALRKEAVSTEFAERNITWIGADSWGSNRPLQYNGLIQGLLSTVPQAPLNKEFEEHFLSLHPKNNSANPWFNEFWEEMFNCSLGGRSDVEECDLDSQRLSQSMLYDQGTFVSFTIDCVYAFAHAIHNMQQDHCPGTRGLCPEILEESNFLKGGAINGELLLEYLHRVSFVGASAERVEFDENGDVRGSYEIINLQRDADGHFSYVTVGTWDESDTEQSMPLTFSKNVQWKHSINGSDVPISICSQPCREGEYQQPAVGNQAECCWICRQCEGAHQVGDGVECHECDLGYRPSETSQDVFISNQAF